MGTEIFSQNKTPSVFQPHTNPFTMVFAPTYVGGYAPTVVRSGYGYGFGGYPYGGYGYGGLYGGYYGGFGGFPYGGSYGYGFGGYPYGAGYGYGYGRFF